MASQPGAPDRQRLTTFTILSFSGLLIVAGTCLFLHTFKIIELEQKLLWFIVVTPVTVLSRIASRVFKSIFLPPIKRN